jgi:GDP-L-fucose synthase
MQVDSKIYVAGHSGLVGSAILRVLKNHGYKNIITKNFIDLDLTKQSQVEAFFQENRPEYVFLAAARVGGILANNVQKADFIYDNLMISANVIFAAHKFGVKKLLNLGSSCIYPKNAPQPLKEEYLLSGLLEPTNEAYAIAKISALKLCRYFNEQYGTNFISVMPTNLFGPNDNFNLETAHVLPAIIRKFHLAKHLAKGNFADIRADFTKFGLPKKIWDTNTIKSLACYDSEIIHLLARLGISHESVTLWGTGDVYREFLHVDDLALALLFLMNNYDFKDLGECINIGVGVDLKISELAQIIKKVVGFDGEVKFGCASSDGTPKKLLDISKISNLGWKANIALEPGIKDTYNWYCFGNYQVELKEREKDIACGRHL